LVAQFMAFKRYKDLLLIGDHDSSAIKFCRPHLQW
jgi:hypothetical protein